MPVKIKVDTTDLMQFANRLTSAQKVTATAAAAGLNVVGDGLVATLATTLSRQTGLGLEEIRGLMKVKRATRSRLEYDLSMPEGLMTEREARKFEGKREKGFGPFEPGQMVVVVTKQDELVCMDCEELEAAGPMPVEVAMEHVPKHPYCRCVIMPYIEKGRRLPLRMTSATGSDTDRRSGTRSRVVNQNATLRQLSEEVINRTARAIRIELR